MGGWGRVSRHVVNSGTPTLSPPPQRPELGGAGWAHSAGNTVLSSDCRPTGSLASFSVAAAAAPSRQGRTALVTSARGGVAGWRGVGGAEGGG